ncbi:hypothetical protein RND71_023556 [Anisodus tanguticus]|uniref:Uncharacterized protein n=1 Tax=Anisodus tanguticus TaxID=243964 RepID=A0AAE1RU37_9SOLA|nr:hypothetical protein RND71_023556 [Anisodus tanguticus]
MNDVSEHEQRPAAASVLIEEIRILIDEEIVLDFTTTFPAANKIVISYSLKEFTTRLMEIMLGITGQAAVSLSAYVSTTSSSSLRGLNFVVAANAVGLIGRKRWRSKKRLAAASSAAGKIGGIAVACAIIVAMGVFLPANAISMWFVGFACLFPAAAAVVFS